MEDLAIDTVDASIIQLFDQSVIACAAGDAEIVAGWGYFSDQAGNAYHVPDVRDPCELASELNERLQDRDAQTEGDK